MKRSFLFLRSPVILLCLVLAVTLFLVQQATYTRQYTEVTSAYTQHHLPREEDPLSRQQNSEERKAGTKNSHTKTEFCADCINDIIVSNPDPAQPLPFDPEIAPSGAIVQQLAEEKASKEQKAAESTKAKESVTKVKPVQVFEEKKRNQVPQSPNIIKAEAEVKVKAAAEDTKQKENENDTADFGKETAKEHKSNRNTQESSKIQSQKEQASKFTEGETKQTVKVVSPPKQVDNNDKTNLIQETEKENPIHQEAAKDVKPQNVAVEPKLRKIPEEAVNQQNLADEAHRQVAAKNVKKENIITDAKKQTIAKQAAAKQVTGEAKQERDSPGHEISKKSGSRVKYLIYVCDKTAHCYGLGDRQRAIVSTYYLAELTNRRFGLVMTSPSDIRDFYEPNLVQWDIPASELPKNASTHEISVLGVKASLHLDTIDFNSVYPQDIVYVRTNHVFWYSTLKNRLYNRNIPRWARIHQSQLMAVGWLRLMKPTPLLRASLNDALVDIATKIQEEAEVWTHLAKTKCCRNISIPKTLPPCAGNTALCKAQNMTSQTCCGKLKEKLFVGCPELKSPCSGVETKSCESSLTSTFTKRWDQPRVKTLAHTYCTAPPPISRLNGTIESIRKKRGYDLTDMNLVCAHIRLGHSKTFPFETHTFNKQQGVSGVWDFLKIYAKKGYHMYLASDAQEVKDEARGIFGERLHMADTEIVHIAYVQKGQDQKAGLQFTLTEQLLLTTACREFVMSHSGYSGRAVEIRNRLMRGRVGRVYRYEDGIVT